MHGTENIVGLVAAIGLQEIVGLIILILAIIFATFLPDLVRGSGQGKRDFKNAADPSGDELRGVLHRKPDHEPDEPEPRRLSVKDHLVLWLAEGFGSGLVPVAPGTFGSIVGVIWFLLLVASGDLAMYITGTIVGLAVSVPLCGAAEAILSRHDPSSVVLDEIAAVPLCFMPWVIIAALKLEAMPPVAHFFTTGAWQLTLGIFVLFRAFDALKPWPISRIQNLPGGWGITADDLLAAVVVALLSLIVVR